MYVTRRISLYNKSYGKASTPPPRPEGPGSGVLAIHDEEELAPGPEATSCWGFRSQRKHYNLPVPQNKMLKLLYTTDDSTEHEDAYCIPVIDQPLSANRYYVIIGTGRHQGEACRCSKEEDVATCCFTRVVHDIKPGPFDYRDVYHQLKLTTEEKQIRAEAVASDGHPPGFLRAFRWQINTSVQYNHKLEEALGVDKSLRARMPDLNFPLSSKHSPAVVVGKWYCPFMFIKEGDRLKDQMKKLPYYEMTLQQFWEEIYSCNNNGRKIVEISVSVRREFPLLNGDEAVKDYKPIVDGFMWFSPVNSHSKGLGLSLPIWERMKWEEDRVGWIGSKDLVERVERTEEYGGLYEWKKFACYVLVERFVLKRMDGGSIALTYDFKHTNKVQSRWE